MSHLEGRVQGDEILFEVSTPHGEMTVLALDTGMTGDLTLDSETAIRLGFSLPSRVSDGELADGTPIRVRLARGTTLWLGSRRLVRAALFETERGCIGMGLLNDVIIHIDTHAGVASIDRAV